MQLNEGPGGAQQWSMTPGQPGPLMMMTTDLALWEDPAYRAIAAEYADNIEMLNANFSRAWKKLTERGASTEFRCFTVRNFPA